MFDNYLHLVDRSSTSPNHINSLLDTDDLINDDNSSMSQTSMDLENSIDLEALDELENANTSSTYNSTNEDRYFSKFY